MPGRGSVSRSKERRDRKNAMPDTGSKASSSSTRTVTSARSQPRRPQRAPAVRPPRTLRGPACSTPSQRCWSTVRAPVVVHTTRGEHSAHRLARTWRSTAFQGMPREVSCRRASRPHCRAASSWTSGRMQGDLPAAPADPNLPIRLSTAAAGRAGSCASHSGFPLSQAHDRPPAAPLRARTGIPSPARCGSARAATARARACGAAGPCRGGGCRGRSRSPVPTPR